MKHPLLNQNVVVRAHNAGVHFGILIAAEEFIVLADSYRVWQWTGAFTLSEVSQQGIKGGRIAQKVDTMTIPIGDVGEIMNLTDDARASILLHLEGEDES